MVRQAALWTFASQIASFAIQFGTAIVVSHLLSPHQVGVFAIAMAITAIIQLFGSFSVGVYVLREEALDAHVVDTAFTINAIISVVLAATIFAASLFGSSFFDDADVPRVVRLLALLPLLSILTFRPSTLLQRSMQVRGISIVNIAALFITSAVTISLAIDGWGSMSLAYGSVAGAVFGGVATALVGRGHNSVRMSLHGWRPITVFGLRLMSIGGVGNATARVCDIITGHFLGLAALGLYSRATSLNNAIFSNIYGAATKLVFAKLSEAERTEGRAGEVYIHAYRLITAVMAPIFLGVAVLAGPLVKTLYGKQWLDAALPLSLLMVGSFIGLCYAMNWELFVLRDEMKTQTRLEMVRSGVNLVLRTCGSLVSLTAVALTATIEPVISLFLYQRHMPRLARTKAGTFYRAYAEMTFLGVAAALPAFVFMLFNRWSPSASLLTAGAMVLLGGGMWIGALLWLRHPLCYEAGLLLKRFRIRVPGALEAPQRS